MCGLVRHLIIHKINMIPKQKVVPNVLSDKQNVWVSKTPYYT